MKVMVAALGAGLAVLSVPPAIAATISSAQGIAQGDIRQYASALFQILSIRKIADQHWQSATLAQRPVLRRQASAAIATVLARHGLSPSRFNEITAAVESQPALRRQVRQHVMRESLGYD